MRYCIHIAIFAVLLATQSQCSLGAPPEQSFDTWIEPDAQVGHDQDPGVVDHLDDLGDPGEDPGEDPGVSADLEGESEDLGEPEDQGTQDTPDVEPDLGSQDPGPTDPGPQDTAECLSGTQGCDGDHVAICLDGVWNPAPTACQYGCHNGKCMLCSPGATRCSGDLVGLEMCRVDGGGWQDVGPCPRRLCNKDTNACYQCRPGEARCVWSTDRWGIEECDDEGEWAPIHLYCMRTCGCHVWADNDPYWPRLVGIKCNDNAYDDDAPCDRCSDDGLGCEFN